MGCWGMGMAQSDEFCEVYEQFMEAYDEGQAVAEITQGILDEYHKEFSDSDGLMHDVYFALAKAEWMCCDQSTEVLSRVKEIVASGENLQFYRELGAHEQDLKTRKKNLEKFLSALQVPRAAPRKRKRKSANAVEAREGMVFWYKSKGIIYGAMVLEILSNGSMFVALSERISSVPKTADDVLDADVYTAARFDALLPSNRIHEIGSVEITDSYNGRAGMYRSGVVHFCENLGRDLHWNHGKRDLSFDHLKMRDLLDSENVPAEFRNQDRLNTLLQSNRPVIWISL